MRNVVYSMMVSIDGFIATLDGGLDWAIITEELHTFANERESEFDIFLYGRRMYETMAGYWPTADQIPDAPAFEVEYARIWRDMPKVVFSTTLDTVEWNARLARDDIAGEVARLKAQPGRDLAVGGASIAASFMERGLVDVCQMYVHPVVLGSGRPMFPALDSRLSMRLVETRTFESGVVFLNYERTDAGHQERSE